MPKQFLLTVVRVIAPVLLSALTAIQTGFAADSSSQTGSRQAGGAGVGRKKASARRYHGLVPPPPPTAVSPLLLSMYPQQTASLPFLASKPHHLADDMKLTAVVDDVAIFKLSCTDDSIHLKTGNVYETVTVAHINPDRVVLEEKGLRFVKHLK
jgi:hypothetical protein